MYRRQNQYVGAATFPFYFNRPGMYPGSFGNSFDNYQAFGPHRDSSNLGPQFLNSWHTGLFPNGASASASAFRRDVGRRVISASSAVSTTS